MPSASPVLLITGASTGIGAATARYALRAGYRVIALARSAEKLAALTGSLGDAQNALAVPCDVSDWESQERAIAQGIDRFGRLDAVFANAGKGAGSPFLGGEDTPDEWRDMVLTNVFGAAATVRLTLPELVKSRGHLILTGSVLGRAVVPGSLYSATKWAVTGMTEAIRQQLVGTGVRVTVIQPGRVGTPFWSTAPEGPLLHPDDVARAVLFALEQPAGVDISEIVLRPSGQRL